MTDFNRLKLRHECSYALIDMLLDACRKELEIRKKFLWIFPIKWNRENPFRIQIQGFCQGLQQAQVFDSDDSQNVEEVYIRLIEQTRKEKRVPGWAVIYDSLQFLNNESWTEYSKERDVLIKACENFGKNEST